MSTPARRPLGEQALYVIREAGERCAEINHAAATPRDRAQGDDDAWMEHCTCPETWPRGIDARDPNAHVSGCGYRTIDRAQREDLISQREALRTKIDQASVRPLPGTSHLLCENRPLASEHHGVDREGKPGKVKVYDLVGSAPVLWCRKGVERRKVPKSNV